MVSVGVCLAAERVHVLCRCQRASTRRGRRRSGRRSHTGWSFIGSLSHGLDTRADDLVRLGGFDAESPDSPTYLASARSLCSPVETNEALAAQDCLGESAVCPVAAHPGADRTGRSHALPNFPSLLTERRSTIGRGCSVKTNPAPILRRLTRRQKVRAAPPDRSSLFNR